MRAGGGSGGAGQSMSAGSVLHSGPYTLLLTRAARSQGHKEEAKDRSRSAGAAQPKEREEAGQGPPPAAPPSVSTRPGPLLGATASASSAQGGGRWMGPLPPGPQTEEPVVGSGAQAVPARLVSREAPTSRGSLGAQRGPPQDGKPGKSGNKTSNMKSWGRRGTLAATSSGRVTGAPATEQAWPCWGGRGGQGGGPGSDDEKGRSRDAPLETDTS